MSLAHVIYVVGAYVSTHPLFFCSYTFLTCKSPRLLSIMLLWPNIYYFQSRSIFYFQYPLEPFLHSYLKCRPSDCRSHHKRMAVPCLLRYKRKLSLPCIGRRYLHNDSKANLLNGWQIADIVIGTRSSGVRVNRNGELQVTSEENSRRGHKTALVLSRASPSLTGYDIRRIFESQNDTPNDLTDRGLEEGVSILLKR